MARYLRNLWHHLILGLRGIPVTSISVEEQHHAALTDPRRI